MSSVESLIDQVLQHDADLRIDGSDIVWSAPDRLPENLLTELHDHKPKVLAIMTGGRGHLDAIEPPEKWSAGVAAMSQKQPPLDWPAHLWPGTVRNARWFLKRWGATAAALGWSVNDCFGVYPHAPYRRLDFMGLAVGMWADRIAVMLPSEAKLWQDGSRLTYRRKAKSAEAVPIWQLSEGS